MPNRGKDRPGPGEKLSVSPPGISSTSIKCGAICANNSAGKSLTSFKFNVVVACALLGTETDWPFAGGSLGAERVVASLEMELLDADVASLEMELLDADVAAAVGICESRNRMNMSEELTLSSFLVYTLRELISTQFS